MTATSPSRIEPAADSPAHEKWITNLTDVVTVVAWRDELIESTTGSTLTASDDTFIWWASSLGCIACVIAHRWSFYAASGPSTWAVEDIARTFGIGESVSRVRDSLDRLERFGITRRTGCTVAVRLWLPPLSYRQRERLPSYLAHAYEP